VHASGGGWSLRKGRDNWAFVGGRARDFVLRASPRVVTVKHNRWGVSYDSSVVRPLCEARYGKVRQGTTPYGVTNCCLSRTQPQQPTGARTRAVGFVPRYLLRGPFVPLPEGVFSLACHFSLSLHLRSLVRAAEPVERSKSMVSRGPEERNRASCGAKTVSVPVC
jgi:hypothetical protein